MNLSNKDLMILVNLSHATPPSTAKEIHEDTTISLRTTYSSLISMSGWGFVDQEEIPSTKKGRPVMGYKISALGREAVSLAKKAYEHKSTERFLFA